MKNFKVFSTKTKVYGKKLTQLSIEPGHPSMPPDIYTTAPTVLAGSSPYSSCI